MYKSWQFAKAVSNTFKQTQVWLRHLQRNLPVSQKHEHYQVISSLHLLEVWPNVPLTFTTGALERERSRLFMAPLRADPVRESEAAYEEEFLTLCKWLAEQKVPASRVQYQYRPNGEELYLVHFFFRTNS